MRIAQIRKFAKEGKSFAVNVDRTGRQRHATHYELSELIRQERVCVRVKVVLPFPTSHENILVEAEEADHLDERKFTVQPKFIVALWDEYIQLRDTILAERQAAEEARKAENKRQEEERKRQDAERKKRVEDMQKRALAVGLPDCKRMWGAYPVPFRVGEDTVSFNYAFFNRLLSRLERADGELIKAKHSRCQTCSQVFPDSRFDFSAQGCVRHMDEDEVQCPECLMIFERCRYDTGKGDGCKCHS